LRILKSSPKKYWKDLILTSPKQAILNNHPSVVTLKELIGDNGAGAFLSFIVSDLVMAFNVGKTVDSSQIEFVAETINQDYYYLKTTELKYCFDKAKKGHYGTTFDRVDASIIIGWIESFIKERDELYSQQRIEENKAHTKELNQIHPKILTKIKQAVDDVIEKQNQPKDEPTKKREKTEFELIVDSWYLEYDDLLKKQSGDTRVKYKDKLLYRYEFINTKHTEYEAQKIKQPPLNIPELSQGWMKEFDALYREQFSGGSQSEVRTITYKGFEFTTAEFLEAKLKEATSDVG